MLGYLVWFLDMLGFPLHCLIFFENTELSKLFEDPRPFGYLEDAWLRDLPG